MKSRFFLAVLFLVGWTVPVWADDSVPYDAERASNSLAVLRVKLMFSPTPLTNAPFRLYFVRTLEVFKNDTSVRFFPQLSVKVVGALEKPGVPEAECTIYLQSYTFGTNTTPIPTTNFNGGWMLLGGDGTLGVSNVKLGTGGS